MVQPVVDPNYETRTGYDENFLGRPVPLPVVRDKGLVATLDDGNHVILYEHFSIVMHKARRLALFTASNVDARERRKKPDPKKNYSRRALGGLGKNDIEQWVSEPRVRGVHQLPDRFFTKDKGAFDKGHIVRRDDVTWGDTYDEVRRANGDTYHVTNCSPQISGFNRSNLGGIWGKLENLVLKQARTEQYVVLSGPVLDEADRIFVGVGEDGPIRAQIPIRYWKVVSADSNGELQSYAFLLSQDLSNVPLEFQVDAAWREKMISIQELEVLVRYFTFPREIYESDQIATDAGEALRGKGKIKRYFA